MEFIIKLVPLIVKLELSASLDPSPLIREKICELDFYRMMRKMEPQNPLTSAKRKLKQLGLTEEEIAALFGDN